MPSSGYEDMGPRIDLGAEPEEPGYPPPGGTGRRSSPPPPPAGGRPSPGSGGRGLILACLGVALLALVLAVWDLVDRPEPVSGPPLSSDVVPGGAAERVAKLEKDVSQLMLRLVTLEKELQSLANKAGTVSQLTELTSKVAALQDRLDTLAVEARLASLSRRKGQPTAPKTEAAKPQTAPQAATRTAPQAAAQKAKPASKRAARKKLTYTVRRGDTLFTVAQRYKVRMKDLMSWNNIKRGDVLKIGEKLVIYK